MDSEYLYRVVHKGEVIFEDKSWTSVEFFASLIKEQGDIKLERAQLEWWPVPPENFERGTT